MHIVDYGNRYGRLFALRKSQVRGVDKRLRWLCKCDCGIRTIVAARQLARGTTRSCGCLRSEEVSARRMKHGKTGTPLYKRWQTIRTRCVTHIDYIENGITVCSEWLYDFTAFEKWAISHGFSPELQLDRQNNLRGYSPDNCAWVTRKQNINNRSNTLIYSAFGVTAPLSMLIEKFSKVEGVLVRSRARAGWEIERALTMPTRRNKC